MSVLFLRILCRRRVSFAGDECPFLSIYCQELASFDWILVSFFANLLQETSVLFLPIYCQVLESFGRILASFFDNSFARLNPLRGTTVLWLFFFFFSCRELASFDQSLPRRLTNSSSTPWLACRWSDFTVPSQKLLSKKCPLPVPVCFGSQSSGNATFPH